MYTLFQIAKQFNLFFLPSNYQKTHMIMSVYL